MHNISLCQYAEKGGDDKECGVHAFSSIILLLHKWSGLDLLCHSCGRLIHFSKFSYSYKFSSVS